MLADLRQSSSFPSWNSDSWDVAWNGLLPYPLLPSITYRQADWLLFYSFSSISSRGRVSVCWISENGWTRWSRRVSVDVPAIRPLWRHPRIRPPLVASRQATSSRTKESPWQLLEVVTYNSANSGRRRCGDPLPGSHTGLPSTAVGSERSHKRSARLAALAPVSDVLWGCWGRNWHTTVCQRYHFWNQLKVLWYHFELAHGSNLDRKSC